MHCTRALGGGMDCYPIDPDRAEAMGVLGKRATAERMAGDEIWARRESLHTARTCNGTSKFSQAEVTSECW